MASRPRLRKLSRLPKTDILYTVLSCALLEYASGHPIYTGKLLAIADEVPKIEDYTRKRSLPT